MSELEDLTARAVALPARSRAELAEILIESLDVEDGAALESAWLSDIQRRDREIRAGASVTRAADEVLREAREQLRCAM